MARPENIWPHLAKLPVWLPSEISDRLAKTLAVFTPHRDGWVRWYNDRTVFVCSKKTPLNEVEERWREKQNRIDIQGTERRSEVKRAASLTLIELASIFYQRNDDRVKYGKPKRMSPVTAWDYQRVINGFGACIGPDTSLDDLGPAHFSRYAKSIQDEAPTTWNRHVAYIEALVRFGLERGYFANNTVIKGIVIGQDPVRQIIGFDFVKLPHEDLTDNRMGKEKSFEPTEIRALWAAADDTEKLWIGLGLNAALDNADLAHLSSEVIDLETGRIDFRRRKRGKVRRVVPIVPVLLPLLKAYRRPEPASPELAELFFLTPTGLQLQRLRKTPVDYLSMKWTRLMQRAGLRPKPVRSTDPETGKRTTKWPEGTKPDGRGFRSLRTTFGNLAPPGYIEEVDVVMGHSKGNVLLDNYLEKHGFGRLKELTLHVWHRAFSCPARLGEACKCPDPYFVELPAVLKKVPKPTKKARTKKTRKIAMPAALQAAHTQRSDGTPDPDHPGPPPVAA